jgi:hypothetical protein
MTLYDKVKATILEKINEFGVEVTIRCASRGDYDPVNDTYSDTTNDYTVKALISNFHRSSIDGSLVLPKDKQLFVPISDTLPRLDKQDKVSVIYDSEEWNVLDAKPILPGGTVLVYKLHLR